MKKRFHISTFKFQMILLLAAVVMAAGATVATITLRNARLCTSLSTLQYEYNAFKADYDSQMGRGTLLLGPGNYTGNLLMDVNGIDLVELIPGTAVLDGSVTYSVGKDGRALFLTRPLVFVLRATLTAGSTVTLFDANAPFKFQVIRAWSIATSADQGTWKLTNGTNDITNVVTVSADPNTINSAGTLDINYLSIDRGESLVVAGDGSLADALVFVECVRF